MARKTDLRVTIDADAAKLERSLQQATRSMQRFESQIRSADMQAAQLDKQLEEQRAQATKRMGQAFVAMGAAIMGGLALATKAAIDWESAWVGVVKVIEGSPEQLARLEKELRNIARTGFPHEEVAQVASALGQLGFATDDIAEVTQVMLDLGVATNMTAEEAAFAIARISNIMGTASTDVQRLGSVIVDLGNNSATTERDITEMALRIAGAGNTIGMTEADVLAFAAALSSVGIESQAGGTAISRVMVNIANAAATGGDAIQGFADVAGVSAEQFTRAFRDDPAQAIALFVTGLGRINDAGGNVFATLSDLGMGEIRVRDALLRMSGAGDLLTDSLERGATAWEENTALVEEAQRRYDTAEVKIQAAKSTLVDLAIDVGSVLLPVLVGLLEAGTDLVAFFADLPGPVQAAAVIFGALFGAVSLLAGGFLLLAPRMLAAKTLLLQWGAAHRVAFGGMIAAGQLAGLATAFAAVGVAMEMAHQAMKRTATGVAEVTEALLDLRQGQVNATLAELVDLRDKVADRNSWLDIIGGVTGFGGATFSMRKNVEEYTEELEQYDKALSSLVQSGASDQAAEAVQALGDQMGLSGAEFDRWVERHFPQYREALLEIKNANEVAAESISPLQNELEDLAIRFGLTGDDAAAAAQQMIDAWSEAGGKFVDLSGAYSTVLQEIESAEQQRAQAAFEASGKTKGSWEDMVREVKVSVDDYLAELERMVENQANWRDNLVMLAGRASDELLDHLVRLGPDGADLVALFAQMTDAELAEAERLWSHSTAASVQAGIIDPVLEAGPVLEKIAREHGQDVADEIRDYMIKHGVGVAEAARELGVKIDTGLRDGEERTIPVQVTGDSRAIRKIREIGEAIGSLKDKTISITASGQVFVGNQSVRGSIGGRAHGGPVSAGTTYLVGEQGPELFQPAVSGTVIPNHALGGRISKIDIKVDSSDLNAADFRTGRDRMISTLANHTLASGKVLPPGSYRVGRGPGAHGYDARDLPAPVGTPVYAAAAGIVNRANRWGHSYGIHAGIRHANWQSLYAHMSQMFVRVGQEVARGQMIGRVGSTGNSTGPHLHLEPDNPRLYDRGGKWATGTWGFNASGGTEYVLSPAQSRMFDRMISVMESRPRGHDGAAASFAYSVQIGATTEDVARKVRAHEHYARQAFQSWQGD